MTVYVHRNGENYGPLTQDQVRDQLQTGKFSPDDLCWREGMAEWQPLATQAQFTGPLSKPQVPVWPVAASQTPVGPYWREGARLLTRTNAELPPLCVKCGRPAGPAEGGKFYRKTFTWTPPLAYLGLLGGLLIFILVAIVANKKHTLTFSVCQEHRKKRLVCVGLAWGSFVMMMAMAVLAASFNNGWIAGIGMPLFLVATLVFSFLHTHLTIRKADGTLAQFSGASLQFLDQLPSRGGGSLLL